MIIGIVGSRRMSLYGKTVIEVLMKELRFKCEVATIDVAGCNREIVRLGAKKIFKGDNFELLNSQLASYADILVVIEGGENSGTILVAKSFLDIGKDVWAVPGNIVGGNSEAPNFLIENGAKVLTKIEKFWEIVQ